jgi:hypothetical protein
MPPQAPPDGYTYVANWLLWTVLVGIGVGFTGIGTMVRAMWIRGMTENATTVTTLVGIVKEATAANADLSKATSLVLTKLDELLADARRRKE